MRAVAGILLIAAATLITATARANGRFPQAQQIATVPGDASTVYLRSTFGMLVSKDGGHKWRWICERALGYEGQWDPSVAVTKDGTLWVGLETGIVSTKDGCSLTVDPETAGEVVKDLTVDAKGETVFAITGSPGKKSSVWRRTPASGKFERLAQLDDVNFMTIEVAPSSINRVYVSGQPYRTIRGQIYRSDDGGKTLTTDIGDGGASSSGLKADGPFFIGAIDKQDPNRLLVRHLHADGSSVLLSKDGGKTFKDVLYMHSSMFGFAKSEDGKSLWAGSGLEEHGIFRSTDRGETWENVAKHGVMCLHSTPGTLFICENVLSYGAKTVSVSHDGGKTIEQIASFADVLGPVECDVPDARSTLCAGSWPDTKNALLAPPDAGQPQERPDGGRSKRKRRDAGAPADEPEPRSKCGCSVPGLPTGASPDLALLTLALGALITRLRIASTKPQ